MTSNSNIMTNLFLIHNRLLTPRLIQLTNTIIEENIHNPRPCLHLSLNLNSIMDRTVLPSTTILVQTRHTRLCTTVHITPAQPFTLPPPPPPPPAPQPPLNQPPSSAPQQMPMPPQPVESGQYAALPSPTSYYPPSTFGSGPRPVHTPATTSGYTDQDGKWQTYPADQHGLVLPTSTYGSGAIMGQTHNGIDDGNLNSLSDAPPDANGNPSKPPYPYTTIIRYAIQGSPRNKLTLSELYASMESRFPWYKSPEAGNGWRVSCNARIYPSLITCHN